MLALGATAAYATNAKVTCVHKTATASGMSPGPATGIPLRPDWPERVADSLHVPHHARLRYILSGGTEMKTLSICEMRGVLGGPFLAALLTAACVSTLSISQVLEQGRYAAGRCVVVTGEVVQHMGEGPDHLHWYEVEDGTGRITVGARQPPPLRCRQVRIEGRVESSFASLTNSARPGVVYGSWWTGLTIAERSRQDLGPSPRGKLFGCDDPPGSPRAEVAVPAGLNQEKCLYAGAR